MSEFALRDVLRRVAPYALRELDAELERCAARVKSAEQARQRAATQGKFRAADRRWKREKKLSAQLWALRAELVEAKRVRSE